MNHPDRRDRQGPAPGETRAELKKAEESMVALARSAKAFAALGKKLFTALLGEVQSTPAESSKMSPGAARVNLPAGSGRPSPAELLPHEQIGTFLVLCAFLAALAGGIGFLISYWVSANNLWLGGTLAVFLGSLGIALILWSHLLTVKREVVANREVMDAAPSERKEAEEEFETGERQIHRRWLLKGMIAAAFTVAAAMFVSLFRSLGASPYPALLSTVWKRGQRLVTPDGKPISVHDLEPGNTVIVFPDDSVGTERAQTVLIRVHEQLLRLPGDREEWAPGGNIAFSRVCTHAGCSVGMYERTTHLLMCPCHQSTFDVLRAAKPTGGPAARPLPQLPLYADSEGFLCAGGGFSEPPGPGFWGMP
jgi:ubiquinol-cytochrome c reductase iron-sulfur subunit